jgi:CRP-like cAMP-binding protein
MQFTTRFPTSERLAFSAGTAIIREGESGMLMYEIVDGIVDVLNQGNHVAALGAGAIVGELACFDGAPRSATVVARTDCILAALDRQQYAALQACDPQLSMHMLHMMIQRMRSMTRMPHPVASVPDVIESPVRPRPVRLRWRPARTGRGLDMYWETEEPA